MNKNFMLQGATKLSKSEMRNVKGGSGPCDGYAFICSCGDGTAVWCSNNSPEQLIADMGKYCSGGQGASCQNLN